MQEGLSHEDAVQEVSGPAALLCVVPGGKAGYEHLGVGVVRQGLVSNVNAMLDICLDVSGLSSCLSQDSLEGCMTTKSGSLVIIGGFSGEWIVTPH